MNITTRYLLVFIALSLLVGGCYSARSGKLPTAVDSYWHSLRWRSPARTANMVHEDIRAEHMQRVTKEMNNRRIVDYNTVNVTFDKDQKQAIVQISYSYYTLTGNDLISAQEIQHWHYDKKLGWLLKKNAPITSDQ